MSEYSDIIYDLAYYGFDWDYVKRLSRDEQQTLLQKLKDRGSEDIMDRWVRVPGHLGN